MPHHGCVDVLHRSYHDLLQDGWDAQCEHHLHGVPQRHLFAPAHLRRKLLKRDGHEFSFYRNNNFFDRLIYYYKCGAAESQSNVDFSPRMIDFLWIA